MTCKNNMKRLQGRVAGLHDKLDKMDEAIAAMASRVYRLAG